MVAKAAPKTASGGSPAAPPNSTASEKRFKGVRMRSWGKWVSEIRLPNTRARLWLGSFATAEQAARAFDVAVVCLRGRSATLNFPDSPPSYAPLGLPLHQIQELAAAAAAAASAAPSASSSELIDVSSQSEPAFSHQSEPSASALESLVQCSSPSSTLSDVASSPSAANLPSAASSSFCCSSTAESGDVEGSCSSNWQDMHSLEGLLRWDENAELSSSYLKEVQHVLDMGVQWDEELLWGPSVGSYSSWEKQLSVFPLLPPEEEAAILVEPCLWNL